MIFCWDEKDNKNFRDYSSFFSAEILKFCDFNSKILLNKFFIKKTFENDNNYSSGIQSNIKFFLF